MGADASELKSLGRDLGRVPANMVPKVKGVVAKGALSVKQAMVKDMRGSRGFPHVSRSIDYDLINNLSTGTASFAAEIGPNKDRDPAASLAGLAYFGGIRGGGSVRDPIEALNDEVPNVIEYLEKATKGLL